MVPDNLEGILFNEYFCKYNEEDLSFVMKLLKHVFFANHKIYTKNGSNYAN